MYETSVTALRGVELDVLDLNRTADFYRNAWGLVEVARDGDTMYLRGMGTEHHILTLHERPKAALNSINFAAQDKMAVDAIHARLKAQGVRIVSAPAALSSVAGGGYGFSLLTPEGQVLNVTADVSRHEFAIADRSRPEKLSHVVLNVEDIERQHNFFCDVLGFRLSDATERMEFVRCSTDHHSIAIARGHGAGLNHMAYEMANFDGLMRGAGRLKAQGIETEWGIGRHGPGNNIFSYFVEPNGFVTEYTTEVERLDEATHVPGTPDYWARVMNGNPDRWGMAIPTKRGRDAMAGKLVEEANMRCDEIIARRMAS